MDVPAAVHHHTCLAGQEQTDCSARGANIDRLEICIQNQYGFDHPVSVNGMIILPLLKKSYTGASLPRDKLLRTLIYFQVRSMELAYSLLGFLRAER